MKLQRIEIVINQVVVYCLVKTICIGSRLLFLYEGRFPRVLSFSFKNFN